MTYASVLPPTDQQRPLGRGSESRSALLPENFQNIFGKGLCLSREISKDICAGCVLSQDWLHFPVLLREPSACISHSGAEARVETEVWPVWGVNAGKAKHRLCSTAGHESFCIYWAGSKISARQLRSCYMKCAPKNVLCRSAVQHTCAHMCTG